RHPMLGNMPNVSATCVSTTTVKQAAPEQRRPLPRSCKRYSRMHVVARWPHRELHRTAEKFKLRHHPTISTTMSRNPNGAVIRWRLRECGRFATWLDICVTVWLRYW